MKHQPGRKNNQKNSHGNTQDLQEGKKKEGKNERRNKGKK